MPETMPHGEFPSLEGELKISLMSKQVTIEMQGDCWYSSMTLDPSAMETLGDWMTLYRLTLS